jgi:hypothetical protein
VKAINLLSALVFTFVSTFSLCAEQFDYRLLATSKTSSMEKEMNQAADAGYAFAGVMGGESAFGGKEVIVVMKKSLDGPASGNRRYVLLATSKTGTLQKELQQAGDEGFEYCGQTVFESAFGGREASIILEKVLNQEKSRRVEFKLLATSKTSTMEKELRQAGEAGFHFLGVVVGKTAFGGKELISVLQKLEK